VRSWLFVLASLLTLPRVGHSVDDQPVSEATPIDQPASQTIPPEREEVFVEGLEPRYVAPTLRDRIGRVWAPVYINGKGPFRLVLDTGANTSAVIQSLASRIGTPVLTSSPVRLHGVTGTSHVPTIRVESLEVGDLLLADKRLAVVEDVFGGAEGVLGTDGLADKRISIDFRHDQISIRRSVGPVPDGYTRVPVKVLKGQLLMLEITLAGVRTKALLDTGAQSTIGNTSLREALAKKARQGREASIVGVTLDVQTGESLSAPPVHIEGIVIRGMRVTFGDIYIFNAWNLTNEPALLIGMDIIGLLDSLVIDYKRKELHMRPRK
jgi:predicted aspartyl protease